MKSWLTLILAVLVLVALIFLVYQPVLEPLAPAPVVAERPPADAGTRDLGETLSFCSDVWLPYIYQPGNSRDGYVVDLLRKIYQPLGFDVQFFILPWSRCLDDVRDGRITASIGTETTDAPDFIFPGASMGMFLPLFYTLPETDWAYDGIDSLQGIRLGVVQDYAYSSDLDLFINKYHQTDRLLISKGEAPLEILFQALREKRIDVFVANSVTVNAFLQRDPVRKGLLRMAGQLKLPGILFVAYSPADGRAVNLAQHYDLRIDELRKDGYLAEVLNNYGLRDWLVEPRYQTLQGRSVEKQP
jgi:polar amino acid transport system substrate-binding protein